jgi:hypothetical protein
VGIRQQAKGAATPLDRDDRLLVLPQTSLALMATPAYAAQLLGADPGRNPTLAAAVDAGAVDAGKATAHPTRVQWSEIVARIEDEENAIPDDATFMMTATHLFASGDGAYVAPGTRGAADDRPLQPVAGVGGPMPETITLLIGAEAPFIDVIAEFTSSADADVWEREVPVWKRKLALNPVVLLSGFSSLIGRTQLSRDGDSLRLHADTSSQELQRLLTLIVTLTKAAQARPN